MREIKDSGIEWLDKIPDNWSYDDGNYYVKDEIFDEMYELEDEDFALGQRLVADGLCREHIQRISIFGK